MSDRKVRKPALVSGNVTYIRKLNVKSYTDIQTAKQEWLLQNYIPLNTCTLFAGIGGIGKSQLLTYLAGAVSTGKSFIINGKEFSIQKGSVVYLNAEDEEDSSVKPRLLAVSADVNKVYHLNSTINIEIEDDEEPIALDRDIKILSELIDEIGDVKLIIIDPITAYLGEIAEHKATEVRKLILRLNRLAKKHNIGIILNTHLRKKSSGENTNNAADEVRGSGAWTATVRKAFVLAKDHGNSNHVNFVTLKNNLSADQDGFVYSIEPVEIKDNNLILKTSRIKWENISSHLTADEVLNKNLAEEATKLDEAKKVIKTELAFNKKSVQYMVALFESLGISQATVRRAKDALKMDGFEVATEKDVLGDKKYYWVRKN